MAVQQIDFFGALGLPAEIATPGAPRRTRGRRRVTPGFEPAKTRTVFAPATGKLYHFEPGEIEVMIGWPDPRAWRKTQQSPWWAHFRPQIALFEGDLSPDIARYSEPLEASAPGELAALNAGVSLDDPFADLEPPRLTPAQRAGIRIAQLARLRWHDTIPRRVRDAIAPFPGRHWHLLSFVARCGEPAFDLVQANPALAYALASSWVFRDVPVQRPLRSARALLAAGKKQRDVLAWLGFPPTEPARRLVRKVIHDAIGIPPLLYLRTAMSDPELLKALSHLPRLNAGAIRIGTDPTLLRVVRPSFLEDVATRPSEDRTHHAAFLLADTQLMFEILRPRGTRFPLARRLDVLQTMHDELVQELNRVHPGHEMDPWDVPELVNVEFPPPPVAGTATIVPIQSLPELIDEGRAQMNCVASYAKRIALQRGTYVYRVLEPERCTLALSRSGLKWVASELRRARNAPPSLETRRAVGAWLASRGGGMM